MARRPALENTLTLTDPKAIRALAHPARQRVIDELYSGAVLTATDAAALCDLTPSAMSYHLRALEKWGIVVRDEGATDGRERPWRAPARNLHLSGAAKQGSSTVAAKALASTFVAPLLEDIEAWAEREQRDDKGAADIAKDRLWLTQDQAIELNETVRALLESWAENHSPTQHAEGAEPMNVFWSLLPKRP
jgi:DNA-binding transcriptional ArsR family regulator